MCIICVYQNQFKTVNRPECVFKEFLNKITNNSVNDVEDHFKVILKICPNDLQSLNFNV